MIKLRHKKAVDGSSVYFVMFGGYNLGIGNTPDQAINAAELTMKELLEDVGKLRDASKV